MSRFLSLALVFTLFLPRCSNLSKAECASAIFPRAHDFDATVVALSPDSRFLVSGGYQGNLRLWEVQRESAVAEITMHDGAVRAVLLLSDKIFASATDKGKITTWKGTTRLMRCVGQ
jgi:WD40 repeat protein